MAAIRKDMILMQIVKIPYSEMKNRYGSKKNSGHGNRKFMAAVSVFLWIKFFMLRSKTSFLRI